MAPFTADFPKCPLQDNEVGHHSPKHSFALEQISGFIFPHIRTLLCYNTIYTEILLTLITPR